MQKKLLLMFMFISCSMMYSGDYTDDLIAQYNEALCSDNPGAIDKVHADQHVKNVERRTEARYHQCNGRHILQPDENSATGRMYTEFESEYSNRSQINDELFERYKKNFEFGYELDRKAWIMNELYLRGLDACGKDKACLLRNDNLRWEEISAPGFVEQQCSTVYDPVLYRGKIVLNKEQKEGLAENNPDIKKLVVQLNEAKQKLQNKIDDLLNK